MSFSDLEIVGRNVLNNYPIEGLEEVLIVKGGQVKSIYP